MLSLEALLFLATTGSRGLASSREDVDTLIQKRFKTAFAISHLEHSLKKAFISSWCLFLNVPSATPGLFRGKQSPGHSLLMPLYQIEGTEACGLKRIHAFGT
jgi:CDP-diacylglycerol pyrophosphatase